MKKFFYLHTYAVIFLGFVLIGATIGLVVLQKMIECNSVTIPEYQYVFLFLKAFIIVITVPVMVAALSFHVIVKRLETEKKRPK